MADRTETKKECDKGHCRKRTDVANVEIIIRSWPIGTKAPVVSVAPGAVEGYEEKTYRGELCPPHKKLSHKQAAALFANTKSY